jgi:hypothetical protein
VHEQSASAAAGDNPKIQLHWDALIRQLDREGQAYAT